MGRRVELGNRDLVGRCIVRKVVEIVDTRTPMTRFVHQLEPLWWLLFVSSTFVSALLLPSFLFVVLVADPLGLTPVGSLHYERVRDLVHEPIGAGFLFVLVASCFWNGAHHLRHLVLDLRGQRGDTRRAVGLYGIALSGSLSAVAAWIAS
jgi:fumarate reductase subunit D